MDKGKILPRLPLNLRKPYEKKVRQRLTVFAVCVLIAVFLWLVIKLSNSYRSEVEYSVNFQNQTSDKILAEASDSTINIKLKSSGFKLLDLKWFSSLQEVDLEVAPNRVTAYNAGNHYNYYMLSYNSISNIERQLDKITTIENIRPDTIYLWMDEKNNRKIAVKPDLNIEYKSQYQPYKAVNSEPDSVRVSGPRKIIDTLSYIRTEPFTAEGVDENISEELKLLLPEKLEASKKTVSLNIDVEEFTETTVEVPIEDFFEDDSSRSLKTFPGKVEVTCWVALKDYQKISSGQFAVTVNARSLDTFSSGDKVKLKVSRFPSYVKNLRVNPKYVEYLIRKHE